MNTAIRTDLGFKGFFLVICWAVFTLLSNKTDAFSPPRNLSLVLDNDFCVNLSWSPPENLNSSVSKVKYLITATSAQGSTPLLNVCRSSTSYRGCLDLENGVRYSVQARPKSCNRDGSEGVVATIPARTEKLVKDFECTYYTSGAMNCTWRPTDTTRDLQVFCWYEKEREVMEPCTQYLHCENKRGCHLSGEFLDPPYLKVFFLINETHGLSTLKNTYQVDPSLHIKPPPPKLNITLNGTMLLLHSDPPLGFPRNCWEFQYCYNTSASTGCQKRHNPRGKPVIIPYDRRQRYHVQVRALCRSICFSGDCASDWSKSESFGEEQSDVSRYMPFIAIPIVVTACIVFLLSFKKLRAWILPQIPDPLRLFKELVNSNEERMAAGSRPADNSAVRQGQGLERQRLYVPEEPELCVNVRVVEPEPEPELDVTL